MTDKFDSLLEELHRNDAEIEERAKADIEAFADLKDNKEDAVVTAGFLIGGVLLIAVALWAIFGWAFGVLFVGWWSWSEARDRIERGKKLKARAEKAEAMISAIQKVRPSK